jgi:hypothetical protein
MSENLVQSRHDLWDKWDGRDAEMAHHIWQEFSMSVTGTVSSLVDMKRIAEKESDKFLSLLQANECPYLLSLPATVCEENTSKKAECMVALYLSLFDSFSDFIYSCMKPSLTSMKGVPRSIAGLDYFCRLSWTFHCLMVFLPTRFPNMRHRFLICDDPHAPTLNMLDSTAIIPGNITRCLQSLPFISLSIFLRCFSATNRGIFVESHDVMGVVETCFPPLHKIIHSISLCEELLQQKKTRAETNAIIDETDSITVCSKVFGIHDSFWLLQSQRLFSISLFQKHFPQIRMFTDSQEGMSHSIRSSRLRSHFCSLLKANNQNLGQKEPPPQDLDTDSFFCQNITAEQRQLSKSEWLNERGLSTSQSKDSSPTKQKSSKASFSSNLRLRCLFIAAKNMQEKWNGDGQSIDIQLAPMISLSGLLLEDQENQSILPKMEVKLYPLGDGDSPCVMHFINAFSPSFLHSDYKYSNESRYCKVTTSDGGSSSIASFFHCRKCQHEINNGDETELFGPLMRIGTNNSVVSIPASPWEKKKMDISTEICNLIIREANRILLETKSEISLRSTSKRKRGFSSPAALKVLVGISNLEEYIGDESLFDSSFNPFPLHYSNCNISKVGNKAKYGTHQDSSWILNSPKAKPKACSANSSFLPTKDEMPVLTMVTGTGDCRARVSWHKDDKELLSIMTNSNCIHLQLCGVQDNGIFHQSDFLNKKESIISRMDYSQGITLRKIDTFRMTACPTCDQEVYREGIVADNLEQKRRRVCIPWDDYSRLKVMSQMEIMTDSKPCALSDNLPSIPKGSATNSPVYQGNLKVPMKFVNPEGTFLKELIDRNRSHSVSKAPIRRIRPLPIRHALSLTYRHQIFSHYQFSIAAFERRSLFHVVDKKNRSLSDQPLFLDHNQKYGGEILLPGDMYQIHELPIIHSRQSTTVVMEELQNIILVVHAYKNDPSSFRKWSEMITSFRASDITQEAAFQKFSQDFSNAGDLVINGFSGSQQVGDSIAPSARTLRVDAPHYTAPFAQQCANTQNSIFNNIREQGRAVAVFLRASTWGDPKISQSTKEALGANQELLFPDAAVFFGYFYISSLCANQLSCEEAKLRFDILGNYFETEKSNCTYLFEKFLQYNFSPVFSSTQIREIVTMRKNKKQLRHIYINDKDDRPLTASENEIFALFPQKNADHSNVTGSLLRDYFCNIIAGSSDDAQGADFLEEISQCPESNRLSYGESLSVHQIVIISFHVQAAAAMRFFRRNVSLETNRKGEKYLTPLMNDDSDLLPDPLRLYALPCVNQDLDPVTQFSIAQMKVLFAYHATRDKSFLVDNDGLNSYTLPPEPDKSQDFLCDCLFASTVNRFTGAINVLSQYCNSKVTGMQLPHKDDWQNFLLFLDKLHASPSMPSIFSQQHYKSLPPQLTANHESLKTFITNLASSEKGFDLLLRRMQNNAKKNGGWATHDQVFSWLLDCLLTCGEFPKLPPVKFLCSKIIGDVESLFPCFVQRKLNDPVILGWGSQNGLDCVDILQENGKPFPPRQRREKFVILHGKLVEYFLSPESSSEKLLRVCGWKIHEGVIVSCLHDRPFSFLDTEHILCKVWLAVLQSNSCRNISKNPRLGPLHCYPLCEEHHWEASLKPLMQDILEVFLQFKKGPDEITKVYRYPQSLMFPGERFLDNA